MNLQSQITEIRRRIAEPYPDDGSDAQVTDDEIVDWLYEAELQVARDADDSAITSSGSSVVGSITLTTGTSPYTIYTSGAIPTILRPISVDKSRTGGATHPCKIASYENYRRSFFDPNWRTSDQQAVVSIYNGALWANPDSSSDSYTIWCVIVPQRRYRRFRGSITTKTSNTVWQDSKLVTAGYPDDYFSAQGYNSCELKYTSGEPNGRVVDVSDYTGATGEVTTATTSWPVGNEAFPPDVNAGDTYEMGEKCPYSPLFDGPLYAYVLYLCFCKADDEMAQKYLADYQRQIGQINAAYAEGGVRQ